MIEDPKKHQLFLKDELTKNIFASSPDAITVSGMNGNIVECNQAALDLHGYSSKEELIGKNALELIAKKDHERAIKNMQKTLEQGLTRNTEYTFLTKDGREFPAELSASVIRDPSGNPTGFMAITKDITERIHTEETLRNSENNFRTLLENLSQKIFFKDKNSVYISCNENYARDLGIKSNEIVGKTDYDFYPRILVEKYRADDKRIIESSKAEDIEEEYVQNGIKFFVHTVKTPIKDENNNVIGIIGIFWDITEKKKMEEKMEYEQDLFDALMDNMPDAIYFKDKDSRFIKVSRISCPGMGISSPEEAVGMTDFDFSPKEMAKQFLVDDHMVMKSGKPIIGKEEVMVSKVGKTWYSATKVPIRNKDGKVIGLVGISRDITKLKETEEKLNLYSKHLEKLVEEKTKQLRKVEWLAAIGKMAAMVGHDLRNPLTVITNAVYYLKNKYGSSIDNNSNEMFQLIEKSIEYSNKIINDLLEFSGEIKLEMAETGPKTILKEALLLVAVPKNIQMVDATQSKPRIVVDMQKMQRVFINLIKNAIEAMPEGGKLTIGTSEVNDSVEFSFSDTGIGISKENMEKIFTPLFTTKTKGMGLGLSICKRMVEAHGGSISVESTVGKGATFKVVIPANNDRRRD
jgi:PAS domain S-box-containing protein